MPFLILSILLTSIAAPKSFEHHIVISGHAALPTPPTSSPEAPEPTFMQDPERYRHPLDLLKHRFLPIGSTDATGTKSSDENDTAMAVDGKDAVTPSIPAKSPKKSQEEKEKTKEKKRKVGSATEPPKKTKKSKAES
jgi:hypothetical protein